MDTTQKAPIIVTQTDGTPVTGFDASVDNPAIGHIQAAADATYLVADSVGSANLNVAYGVQTGVLSFTVTAAPLVITLGPAVPKV